MECGCEGSDHYKKHEESTTAAGQLYKGKLALLYFLRGVSRTKGFHLAANLRSGRDFGDIVFRNERTAGQAGGDESCKIWFVKVLHEETSPISLPDLISFEGNWSLVKCCEVFQSIISKDNEDLNFLGRTGDVELVIYTNAVVDKHLIRECSLSSHKPDNFLNCCSKDLSFSICEDAYADVYEAFEDLVACKAFLDELVSRIDDGGAVKKLIDEFTSSMKTKVMSYQLSALKENPSRSELSELIDNMKCVDNVSQYKSFLPKVHFFPGQPCEEELNDAIKTELEKALQISKFGACSLFEDLQNKILTWCKMHNCYLTQNATFWTELLSKLPSVVDVSSPYLSNMNPLNIAYNLFQISLIRSSLNAKVFNVVSDSEDLTLSSLKICQIVEADYPGKYLIISLKSLLSRKRDVLLRWPTSWCSILIIVCECDVHEQPEDLRAELCDFLSFPDSRIVLISTEINKFASSFKSIMKDYYCKQLDSSRFLHLEDESQSLLLKRDVIFQGYLVPLKELVGPTIVMQEKILTNTLSELVKKEMFVLGPKCRAPVDCCIPRTLDCFIPINMSYLKSSTCDIIAMSNIVIGDLSRYLFPQEEINFFNSTSSAVNAECRFFILTLCSTCDVFDLLCSHFENKNVHHLMFDGERLVWKATKGNPSSLRDYILREISAEPKCLLEFMSKSLKSSHNPSTFHDIEDNFVVVTGEPGIGKSTLLKTLTSQTKSVNPATWIITLNLSNFTNFLSKCRVKDLDEDRVFELLVDSLNDGTHVVTDFEVELLEYSIKNKGNIIILIDGFDEINPLFSKRSLAVIRVLKELKLEKLWITSRRGINRKLLELLNAVEYELKPFTQEDQKQFFMSVWSRKFPNAEQGTISKFIHQFQETVCMDRKCEKSVDLGNALQNMMLTEIFQGDVNQFISGDTVDLPKTILLIQLYNRFIEVELQAKNVKKTSPEKWYSLEASQTYHMACALISLLEGSELNQFQVQDVTVIMSDLLSVAENNIVVSPILQVIHGVPQFSHRSLAEYFVGLWFSRNFRNCRDFLTNQMFRRDFAFVRYVFDWYLAREHNLHLAVVNHDVDTVKNLLNLGAYVNDLDNGGRTPLHLAILHSKQIVSAKPAVKLTKREVYNPITKLLVGKGANVKMMDEVLLWRPSQYASALKVWDALDLVLHDQLDMNELSHLKEKLADQEYLQEGLLISCQRGYFNLVDCFAACGVDITVNSIETREGLCNPLHLAARYGHLKLVRCLLSKKVKLSIMDKKGNSPLHYAVREGKLDVVQYLVQRGADVNAQDKEGNTPLNQIVCKGDLQIVVFLIEQLGCNIHLTNKYGDTPLHRAAGSGHLTLVEFLLSKGADINATNKDGNSPLHRAVYVGHLSIVKTLLENGADVNLCNNNGDTALSLNAGGGNLLIVQCLVESGSAVKHCNANGNTALHWAARQNNLKVIAYLLDKGADINFRNHYGNTALHRAVEFGCSEAARLLKERGACVSLVNRDGYTCATIRSRKCN